MAREREATNPSVGRRSFLKLVGAGAASAAAIGAANGSALAAEYRTIELQPGEIKQVSVNSGETYENVLFDMRASGAEARIVARGDNWMIRNVGWLGATDNDGGVPNMISAKGNGVIDSCYIGNGVSMDVSREGAIGVPRSHSGSLTIKNTYIGGWSDNGVYAGGVAEGGRGEIHVDNCYCINNNIAHLRIASDGSTIRNTTIVNNGSIPRGSHGTNSRGIWDGYGDASQVITIENCNIDSTGTDVANSALVAGRTTFEVRNCDLRGRTIGNVNTTNVTNAPDVTPPAGVPLDPYEAASQNSSSGGSGDTVDLPNTVSITGGSASSPSTYQFAVTDTIRKSTARNATIDTEDEITDGTVSGMVAGGTDSYEFAGEISSFDTNGDASIYLNDQQVDPASFGADSPSKVVIFDGSETPNNSTMYSFVVDGDVEKDPERGSTNPYDTISNGAVTGRVLAGVDAYRFSGKIVQFHVSGGASVTIEDLNTSTST